MVESIDYDLCYKLEKLARQILYSIYKFSQFLVQECQLCEPIREQDLV